MKIKKKNRKFKTGITDIIITHVADLKLSNDELITIKVNKKTEYDITKKNWGFYSTPSINKRLLKFNFKTCIIKNKTSKNIFILIVDKNKIKKLNKYIKNENCIVIKWLS